MACVEAQPFRVELGGRTIVQGGLAAALQPDQTAPVGTPHDFVTFSWAAEDHGRAVCDTVGCGDVARLPGCAGAHAGGPASPPHHHRWHQAVGDRASPPEISDKPAGDYEQEVVMLEEPLRRSITIDGIKRLSPTTRKPLLACGESQS